MVEVMVIYRKDPDEDRQRLNSIVFVGDYDEHGYFQPSTCSMYYFRMMNVPPAPPEVVYVQVGVARSMTQHLFEEALIYLDKKIKQGDVNTDNVMIREI